MSFRNSIFAMLPLVISAQALATVDALFTQNVIAQGIQSRQLCFVKVPMIGEFGIPEATMARMVFEPIYIAKISSSRPTQSVNINEITKQGRMTYSFDFNQPVEAAMWTRFVMACVVVMAFSPSVRGDDQPVNPIPLVVAAVEPVAAAVVACPPAACAPADPAPQWKVNVLMPTTFCRTRPYYSVKKCEQKVCVWVCKECQCCCPSQTPCCTACGKASCLGNVVGEGQEN